MTIRPTYANVVSTLALVLALGGTGAYAAGLAKDSVTSKQIKNGSIKGKDVKADTLTGKQIDEKSLAMNRIWASPFSSGTLAGSRKELGNVAFTAPAGGFVKVTAQASFNANMSFSYIETAWSLDGQNFHYSEWNPGDNDGYVDEHQNTSHVIPITAGPHQLRVTVSEATAASPSYASWVEGQLIVEFFPAGQVPPAV